MFENALFAIISHFKGVNIPFVFGLRRCFSATPFIIYIYIYFLMIASNSSRLASIS